MERRYLGDSVYAGIESGMLKLTTENGLPDDPSNTIFLEPSVLGELLRYVDDLKTAAAEERP